MLKANKFGRYDKKQILDNGYRILKPEEEDKYYTATEIKKMLGIKLSEEQRLAYNKGFLCKRGWYGCVPTVDESEILAKMIEGEI